MDKADIHIEWQEGNGESVEIGYLNPNSQQCCGHCGVPGTIMASMLTRLNALTAAMYMEQMDLICMRESALSVKKEHLESDIGGLSNNEII